VIDGPEPGYYTDIVVWRDCQTRVDLNAIMIQRATELKPPLRLLADKIYNSSALLKVMWSWRHGQMYQWMLYENRLASGIRVSVEWAFGKIMQRNKYADFEKGQFLQRSPLEKHYVVAVLLANCHTCLYGSQHSLYFHCQAPLLVDYLQ
jgi:hypothetical protein